MAYTDSYGAGVLDNPRHLSNLNKENTLDNFYYELKCMKCIRVCSRSSLNFFLFFFNPFKMLLILLWRSCSLSYVYRHFKICFVSYFNSYDFHHRVYYELTMACSPVSLISSMDRALRLVITKVRMRFRSSLNFFSFFFSTALVVSFTLKIILFFITLDNYALYSEGTPKEYLNTFINLSCSPVVHGECFIFASTDDKTVINSKTKDRFTVVH